MLDEALSIVRELCDEAIAEDDTGAATSLSRLASTLHDSSRYRTGVLDSHHQRDDVHAVFEGIITIYLDVARDALSTSDYEQVSILMLEATPTEVDSDADCVQLAKEFDQVHSLFMQAAGGKLVGEACRLGNLLAKKAKQYTRLQVEVGELVTGKYCMPLQQQIGQAHREARTVLGPEKHNSLTDLLIATMEGNSHGSK